MTKQKFGIIVVDPPWSFNDKLKMSGVKRGAESNYSVLNLESLKALPVPQISHDNSILALWVPSALLQSGIELVRAWGYNYKQLWIWAKTCKGDRTRLAFGMGRLARNCHEPVLIGIKGKYTAHLKNHSQRNVFMAPSAGHSRKPEELQDMLELMFPDWSKLELFARRDRQGWLCVGDECPSTRGVDIRDSIETMMI